MKRAAALLFVFFAGLYLLSSAGHTSSNDEEELYYMTQGLVEHHSLALPDQEAVALWVGDGPRERAADGRYYSYHQPLASVLAVPFYVAGSALADRLDRSYHDFVTRAAVTGLAALASAALLVVVALTARQMGASVGQSLALASILGGATMVWAYARNFWSEPLAGLFLALAVLLALVGARRGPAIYWLLSAVCCLLAIATRWAMLVSVPALLVYALLTARTGGPGGAKTRYRLPRRGQFVLAPSVCFLGPFALMGVAALAVVVFVPGYRPALGRALLVIPQHVQGALLGLRQQGLAGVYGLLLSPGKSVFLYSPPLLVALLCMPAFVRRLPREAVLLGLLILAHLLAAGLLPQWAGDAAWGPRYLLPAVPYLLLPLIVVWQAGAASWLKRVLPVFVGLGVAVQLLPIVANFDTYVLEAGGSSGLGAEQRWFNPSASPLLAAPRQFVERVAAFRQGLPAGAYALASGWYPGEGNAGALPRWSTGQASVVLRSALSGPGSAQLTLVQPDHGQPQPLPRLHIQLDGRTLPADKATVAHPRADLYVLDVSLPEMAAGQHQLQLLPDSFIPAEIDGGNDQRLLGVQLQALDIQIAGIALQPANLPSVPPLPVSHSQLWNRAAFGWFYDTAIPHLADVWPWYFAQAGLRGLLWFELLPLALCLAGGAGLLHLGLKLRQEARQVGRQGRFQVEPFPAAGLVEAQAGGM